MKSKRKKTEEMNNYKNIHIMGESEEAIITENFHQINVKYQTAELGSSEKTKQNTCNKQTKQLHLGISDSNCRKLQTES